MRIPFKEAIASNLASSYREMSLNAELRADIHDALVELEDTEEFEENQVRAIKMVLHKFLDLYHICDRNQPEFQNMIEFLNPKTPE